MDIKTFYYRQTATFTYVVIDENSSECAVIDPVLDYDLALGKTSTTSLEKVISFIRDKS